MSQCQQIVFRTFENKKGHFQGHETAAHQTRQASGIERSRRSKKPLCRRLQAHMTIEQQQSACRDNGGAPAVTVMEEEPVMEEERKSPSPRHQVEGTLSRQTTDRTLTQDISVDDDGGDEDGMIARWKAAPFAVGLTKDTWAAEGVGCVSACRAFWERSPNSHLMLTACLCSRLGAGRVGNMVVCYRSETEMPDPYQEDSATDLRPRLHLVLGPYWAVCFLVTIPFFLALTVLVGVTRIPTSAWYVAATWTFAKIGLFGTLMLVSCRDPGMLYRYRELPRHTEGEWRWNSQALTYRPLHAKYDPECAAVIEQFHHVCPWTGTAIGRRNQRWFNSFIFFTVASLTYDVTLLAMHP